MRHGGKILVDQLAIEGVKRVLCVPGKVILLFWMASMKVGLKPLLADKRAVWP